MTFETPPGGFQVGSKIFFTNNAAEPQRGIITKIRDLSDGRAILSVLHDGAIVDLTRQIN